MFWGRPLPESENHAMKDTFFVGGNYGGDYADGNEYDDGNLMGGDCE